MKMFFLSDVELYEDILGEKFPNRFGLYIEFMIRKADVPLEICQFETWKDGWQRDGQEVIITLGKLSTGNLLKLKKNFKLQDYLGMNSYGIFPWYNAEYLFNRGKGVEVKTINLMKEVYELVKTQVLEKK